MMNRYKYIISILLAIASLSACKKTFLDVDNQSQFYRQSYVKDLSTMEQFVNGIYLMLTQNYENGFITVYPELVADNLKPLATGTQLLMPHYTWSQQANNAMEYSAGSSTTTSLAMNGIWTTCYLIIRACNFVIEDVDKYRGGDPDKADDFKGQALAIRAMVHFRLANIFAQCFQFTSDASHLNVPYITTSDITQPYSRQTTAAIYDAMITDLENAIDLLPDNITDTRFMNQAAAKGMLARVNLFKDDYAKAKDWAMEICDQFPLLTISNGYPNDLFKEKSPKQSEILFRFTPVRQTGVVSSFIGRYLRGSLRRFTATNDIANIIKENTNDIRNAWVTNASGVWNVTKFPVNVTPEITPAPITQETAYYAPGIRSSEMFFIVAEASAKMGDENTARNYLDAIRKRANPTIVPVTATGTALLDSIYKERRKELAFEGLRMYDLQRWKIGVNRIDALSGAPKSMTYPNDRAIAPIPLQDVTIAGLEQNKSY